MDVYIFYCVYEGRMYETEGTEGTEVGWRIVSVLVSSDPQHPPFEKERDGEIYSINITSKSFL